MESFKDRVLYALDCKGLTKADLSRATNIPESTIRGWFKDKTPSIEAAAKVAEFLDMSLDYLIGGKGPSLSQCPVIPTQDQKKLLHIYENLTARDKKTVLNVAENLSKPYGTE